MNIIRPKKDDIALPPGLKKDVKLSPLKGCIRVQVDEESNITEGGLVLPDQASKRRTFFTGVVEEVGSEVEEIQVGWRVAWPASEMPYVYYGEGDRTIILDQESVAARILPITVPKLVP